MLPGDVMCNGARGYQLFRGESCERSKKVCTFSALPRCHVVEPQPVPLHALRVVGHCLEAGCGPVNASDISATGGDAELLFFAGESGVLGYGIVDSSTLLAGFPSMMPITSSTTRRERPRTAETPGTSAMVP